MAKALCVNCFQFVPENQSISYMLNLGYDGEYGTYSFTFSKNLFNQYIEMDNIICAQEEYHSIKEHFREYFDSSLFLQPGEEVKYEDISDILRALFDYCYEYLVENGFHITQVNANQQPDEHK